MACIATPFFSNSSIFTLKRGCITLPCRRCSPSPPRKRLLASRELRCQKMYVPGTSAQIDPFLPFDLFMWWWIWLWIDLGFAEASPEAKAARNLQDFFTYLAVKIVLAQLEVVRLPFDPLYLMPMLARYIIFYSTTSSKS